VLYGLCALSGYEEARHNIRNKNWFILELARVSSTRELEDVLLQRESVTSCDSVS